MDESWWSMSAGPGMEPGAGEGIGSRRRVRWLGGASSQEAGLGWKFGRSSKRVGFQRELRVSENREPEEVEGCSASIGEGW